MGRVRATAARRAARASASYLPYLVAILTLTSVCGGCTPGDDEPIIEGKAAKKPELIDVRGPIDTVRAADNAGAYPMLPARAVILKLKAPWPAELAVRLESTIRNEDLARESASSNPVDLEERDAGYWTVHELDVTSTPDQIWTVVVSPPRTMRRGPGFTLLIRSQSTNPAHTGADKLSEPLSVVVKLPPPPQVFIPTGGSSSGGTGTTPTPTRVFTAGLFTETTPDLRTPGGTPRNSPNNTARVRIVTGTSAGLPADFTHAAIWESTSGTTNLGGPIGFALGPSSNVGGAGFCAGSTAGVVLSATRPSFGYASDYVFLFTDLLGPATAVFEHQIESTKGPPPLLVVPRVQFSKDCKLAIVVGADKFGASNYQLNLLDLEKRRPIGSGVAFNDTSFSAEVVNVNGTASVRIKTGTNTTTVPL